MSEFLITDTKEIALITVNNLPNNIYYVSKLINLIKNENIRIDYFTKQHSLKNRISVSFTLKENLISRLFEVIKKARSFIPEISTEISGNNTRLSFLLKNTDKLTLLTHILNTASNMKLNIHLLNFTDSEVSILLPTEYLNEFKRALIS